MVVVDVCFYASLVLGSLVPEGYVEADAALEAGWVWRHLHPVVPHPPRLLVILPLVISLRHVTLPDKNGP